MTNYLVCRQVGKRIFYAGKYEDWVSVINDETLIFNSSEQATNFIFSEVKVNNAFIQPIHGLKPLKDLYLNSVKNNTEVTLVWENGGYLVFPWVNWEDVCHFINQFGHNYKIS